MIEHAFNYTAPRVVGQFMRSDAEFKAILGPYGSGKSVGCCVEILRRCIQQKKSQDGFRYSRWVVVRNVRQQIKDTTLKTWFSWIKPGLLGRWKETESTFYLEFNDVKAEIMFRALDTPEDVQKVLSLEITGCWLNECQFIPREIVEGLQGRLKRYPSKEMGGSNYWSMIADTNPPAMDTYWYKVFEHIPVEENDPNSVVLCDTFKQPSGLSPDADNVENLADGYYEKLATGKSAAFVNASVHAEYPPSQAGKPVYHSTFKRKWHISTTPLPIHPTLPVIVGQDFGLTPAGLWMQMQEDGRIYVLRETPAFDMGTKRYIRSKFRPMQMSAFPTNPIIVIGDPSGVRRADSDEGTSFKEFKDAGYIAKPAATNDPEVRIKVLDELFSMFPDGEPAIIIDPSCKAFTQAMESGYRYPKKKQAFGDEYADKPDKSQACSHLVEGGQYGAMFLTNKRYDPADYVVYDEFVYNPLNQVRSYRPAQREGY
jgi:hypothetical protein